MSRPCDAPGPMYGRCGNAAAFVVRRRDGTRGVGYWCRAHRETFEPYPGRSIDELLITPLAPQVTP